MKNLFRGLTLALILSGCTFTSSETGLSLNMQEDATELQIAKQAITYIQQNDPDNLKSLFDTKIAQQVNAKSLNWLLENGKKVIENNTYPADSTITVSKIRVKSLTGIKFLKEFSFPFYNEQDPDKTMYFKIRFNEDKIDRLLLSTGMRIKSLS